MPVKNYKVSSVTTYNGSEEAIEQLEATTAELEEVKETLTGVVTGTAQYVLNQDDHSTVRDGAFDGCINLLEYSNKTGVLKTIGENAFRNCSSLINIPRIDSGASIGANAFQNCSKLNPTRTPGSITVPSHCFEGCTSLGITISTKGDIGEYAFRNSGIIRVDASPDGTNVLSIYPYAFEGCTQLQRVIGTTTKTYPMRIFDGAFKNCTSLSIFAPMYYVDYIGDNAFQNCTGLTGVLFKESIAISPNAFNGCTNLAGITYQGTVEQAKEIFHNGIGIGVPTTVVNCSDGQYTIGS